MFLHHKKQNGERSQIFWHSQGKTALMLPLLPKISSQHLGLNTAVAFKGRRFWCYQHSATFWIANLKALFMYFYLQGTSKQKLNLSFSQFSSLFIRCPYPGINEP